MSPKINPVWKDRDETLWELLPPSDRQLIERLLSSNQTEQETLLRNHAKDGRLYIAVQETKQENIGNGRTIYLKLAKEVHYHGESIRVLRFKGIRPMIENGAVPAHRGAGYVGGPTRKGVQSTEQGDFYVSDDGDEPQGGMTESSARLEYSMMVKGVSRDEPLTDYPLGWGLFNGFSFEGESLAWCVAAMPSDDERLTASESSVGTFMGLWTTVLRTEGGTRLEDNNDNPDNSFSILERLGILTRTYQDMVGFHRYLHFGNIGVIRDPESRRIIRLVLRDLNTTIPRGSFSGTDHEQLRQETTWRMLDYLKVLENFTGFWGRLAEGRPLFLAFVRGFFYDQPDNKIKHLMTYGQESPSIRSDLRSADDGHYALNPYDYKYGRLWRMIWPLARVQRSESTGMVGHSLRVLLAEKLPQERAKAFIQLRRLADLDPAAFSTNDISDLLHLIEPGSISTVENPELYALLFHLGPTQSMADNFEQIAELSGSTAVGPDVLERIMVGLTRSMGDTVVNERLMPYYTERDMGGFLEMRATYRLMLNRLRPTTLSTSSELLKNIRGRLEKVYEDYMRRGYFTGDSYEAALASIADLEIGPEHQGAMREIRDFLTVTNPRDIILYADSHLAPLLEALRTLSDNQTAAGVPGSGQSQGHNHDPLPSIQAAS